MYSISLDKKETFEASIQIEGAATERSSCRLILECDNGLSFLCKGIIENNKCKIEIPKLKGIIENNTTGNIVLEVIAEETVLIPWSSKFTAKNSKNVTVEVKTSHSKESKPKVVINLDSFEASLKNHLVENNVTLNNLKPKWKSLKPKIDLLIKEHNYNNYTELSHLILKLIKEK